MDHHILALRKHLNEVEQDRRVLRAYVRGTVVTAVLMMALFSYTILFAQVPREAHEYKRDIIREGRSVWGLSAPTATFAGQIHQESAWNPNAVSRVGATGLAQFMPSTATWISGAYSEKLGVNQPLNPQWAIRALVTYDKHLFDRVQASSTCERMAFALSAYNGGLGRVYQRKQISPTPGRCFNATCDINPGIADYNQRENREYPRKILFRHEPLYAAAGFGSQLCSGYGVTNG